MDTVYAKCMQMVMYLKVVNINVSVLRVWGYRKAVVYAV